ncbi:hypothetical protein ACHQM5_025982 [Ranunculus cassubicifolius]
MSFLNFISIRNRRKTFLNQLSKKIYKKKQQFSIRKKKFHFRSSNPEEDEYVRNHLCRCCIPLPPRPIDDDFHVAGRPYRKLPPPTLKITWRWNTGKDEDVRNWLELPPEITLRVFSKLETIDILLTVSQVCSSWRNLSKEPILYRSIVIGGYDPVFRGRWMRGFKHIAMKAADRSCGKLEQFSCGNMSRFYLEHLHYILDSSSSIKSLRLGLCSPEYIIPKQIVEVVKNIPTLEELCLHCIDIPSGAVQDIGLCCPKLKYLQIGVFYCDAEMKALEIAKSMSCLRGLRFQANRLTNKGLQAILDGCPHLEYINLKGFSNVDGAFLKKPDKIKSIMLLNKSDEFGEEREFYLKATSDGQCLMQLSNTVEEVSDYRGLSFYKSPFLDYIDPYFKLNL